MAKLLDYKNPLTATNGNLLSVEDWKGAIFYVMFIGAAFTFGSKLMAKIDDMVIPGDVTPKQMRAQTTVTATDKDAVKVY